MAGFVTVSHVDRAFRAIALPTLVLVVLLASPLAAAAQELAATPGLVEIRAAHHPGYDRIVFEFEGPPPAVARARWVRRLRLDPSDLPAHVHGNAFLRVRFWPATAHDAAPPPAVVFSGAVGTPERQGEASTPQATASLAPDDASPASAPPAALAPAPPAAVPVGDQLEGRSVATSSFGPARRAYALPNIAHVVLLGDYEGDVSFGIGLMARTRLVRATMLRDPSRFVLDISSRYPKRSVRVYFADEHAIVEGDLPPVLAVRRTVPRASRAASALQRLYAGPTAQERARGLRLIASGTTGFRDLRINGRGVARVTLRGRCDSMGSAIITIGDQIRATLKARPSVDRVKIHDRDGQTTLPWGRRDSDPYCLEP